MTQKTAMITGGTSGIGYEAAKALLNKGYHVLIAARNNDKGSLVIKTLQQYGSVTFLQADFAELASIHQLAKKVKERYSSLDCLINNAGVMIPPHQLTKDGFELQFGTNHLGHFAITGLLLPLLLHTPKSRIITISSIAAIKGSIDFNNLDGNKHYKPMVFYRQSKYANLLFAKELQDRLAHVHSSTISVVAHPGLANSNLLSRGSGNQTNWFIRRLLPFLTQSAADGAKTTIYAATNPHLFGGEWIGPNGFQAWRGSPVVDPTGNRLFDKQKAQTLWRVSEELTTIHYPFKDVVKDA